MTSTTKSQTTIMVFAGPGSLDIKTAQSFKIRPPAGRGDLAAAVASGADTIVFLDGIFHHRAAVGHQELLEILTAGVIVIGAASMGALRAIELRHYGAIGCGAIYNALLRGFITDDSELALAMCPFTYQPLTVPLVEVRTLAAAAYLGGCSNKDVETAFSLAQKTFFMERTPAKLAQLWMRDCRNPLPLIRLLEDSRIRIKQRDGLLAIRAAEDPEGSLLRAPEALYWNGEVIYV